MATALETALATPAVGPTVAVMALVAATETQNVYARRAQARMCVSRGCNSRASLCGSWSR